MNSATSRSPICAVAIALDAETEAVVFDLVKPSNRDAGSIGLIEFAKEGSPVDD